MNISAAAAVHKYKATRFCRNVSLDKYKGKN